MSEKHTGITKLRMMSTGSFTPPLSGRTLWTTPMMQRKFNWELERYIVSTFREIVKMFLR